MSLNQTPENQPQLKNPSPPRRRPTCHSEGVMARRVEVVKTWLQRIGIGTMLAIGTVCIAEEAQAKPEKAEESERKPYFGSVYFYEENPKNVKIRGIKSATRMLNISYTEFKNNYTYWFEKDKGEHKWIFHYARVKGETGNEKWGIENYSIDNPKNAKIAGIRAVTQFLGISFGDFRKKYDSKIYEVSEGRWIIRYWLKGTEEQAEEAKPEEAKRVEPKLVKPVPTKAEGDTDPGKPLLPSTKDVEVPKNAKKADFICTDLERMEFDGVKTALMELGADYANFKRTYDHKTEKVEGSKCRVRFWKKKIAKEEIKEVKLDADSLIKVGFISEVIGLASEKHNVIAEKYGSRSSFTNFTLAAQIQLYDLAMEKYAIQSGKKKGRVNLKKGEMRKGIEKEADKIILRAIQESGILTKEELEAFSGDHTY